MHPTINTNSNKKLSYHAKRVYSEPKVARIYDQNRFVSPTGKLFNELEQEALFTYLPKNKSIKILEIGSGTGRFSIKMAEKGYNVVASDVSQPMQNIIKQKVSNMNLKGTIKLKIADTYNLPFKNSTFDVVVCIRVLNQLLLNKDKRTALNEISRVLKPNGIAIVEYINSISLSTLNGTLQTIIKQKSLRPYKMSGLITPTKMTQLTTQTNLKKLNTTGIFLFSQRFYTLIPQQLIRFFNGIDKQLAHLFPFFCTRVFMKLSLQSSDTKKGVS